MYLNILYRIVLSFIILQATVLRHVYAQEAYFVDGYHGGVYGHYPRWKTRYMVEELRKNPEWKINLEIEPETWDSVRSYDPEAPFDVTDSELENTFFNRWSSSMVK